MTTRRLFVKNSALAMVGVGAVPVWLARAASSSDGKRRKVLVTIFQRGAADGLNIVVPHGEKLYYDLRPSIAIARDRVVDLDGFFGLHPSLTSLKALYESKQLAVIQAVGSPDPTRSHFDAQDYMEAGTPGLKSTRDGWLNRAMAVVAEKPSPVRAVSLGAALPRAMRGKNSAVAVSNLADFRIRDNEAAGMFQSMYASTPDSKLTAPARDTFEALALVESIQKRGYAPANGASYPAGRFGASLKQIAQLIKADAGVEVAFADIGGWDHHVNETPQLTNLLSNFGDSLAAFHRDLGDRMEDVTIVTMSEFGRTARENGNRGTDHGHANCMFVLGGAVRGGRVYGKWPGLEREQLYEGRDLALTTDFRAVLIELVAKQLGNRDLAAVFPGFKPEKGLDLIS